MSLHNKKILLVEDDYHIYELVRAMLKPYSVELDLCEDGESGLKKALRGDYSLILLDIMLPEKDGWEICRKIKGAGVGTPVIILTAKVEEADKVLGLELGADDYITKPFSPRETVARIKAVLRRWEDSSRDGENGDEDEGVMRFDELGLVIDPGRYRVHVDDNPLELTPKEFELLSFMAAHEGQVFTREKLLNKIWGYDNYAESRTVDEHIKRLRQKIGGAGLEEVPLVTVWGVGYKFEIEPEDGNGDRE